MTDQPSTPLDANDIDAGNNDRSQEILRAQTAVIETLSKFAEDIAVEIIETVPFISRSGHVYLVRTDLVLSASDNNKWEDIFIENLTDPKIANMLDIRFNVAKALAERIRSVDGILQPSDGETISLSEIIRRLDQKDDNPITEIDLSLTFNVIDELPTFIISQIEKENKLIIPFDVVYKDYNHDAISDPKATAESELDYYNLLAELGFNTLCAIRTKSDERRTGQVITIHDPHFISFAHMREVFVQGSDILENLFEDLLKLHRAAFVHRDLHVGNYAMYTSEIPRIYWNKDTRRPIFIDLGASRYYKFDGVIDKEALANSISRDLVLLGNDLRRLYKASESFINAEKRYTIDELNGIVERFYAEPLRDFFGRDPELLKFIESEIKQLFSK